MRVSDLRKQIDEEDINEEDQSAVCEITKPAAKPDLKIITLDDHQTVGDLFTALQLLEECQELFDELTDPGTGRVIYPDLFRLLLTTEMKVAKFIKKWDLNNQEHI